MLHIKFQVPRSSGSLVLQPTTGVTDRWTDGQAQTNMPPQLLRSSAAHSGRKNQKKKKRRRRRERKMNLQVANPTEYNERKNKNGTQ